MSQVFNDDQLVLEGHGVSFLRALLFRHIEAGRLEGALDIFSQLGEKKALNLEDFDILKCLHFWMEQRHGFSGQEDTIFFVDFFERCWRDFERFIACYHIFAPDVIKSLKFFVYQKILRNYLLEYQSQRSENIDLILKIAYYKGETGKVVAAIEALQYAQQLYPKDAHVQMRLAYYLCCAAKDKEMKKKDTLSLKQRGMCLFRDTFLYIFPFEWTSCLIDDFLYCVSLMRSMTFSDEEIKHWLPVVAMREGIFVDFPYLLKDLVNVFNMIEKEKTIFDDNIPVESLSAKNIYRMYYFLGAMDVAESFHFSTVEQLRIYKNKQKQITQRLNRIF